MCGITSLIGYNSSKIIIDSLYQLQNRGYDSAGISSIFNNKIIVTKKSTSEDLDSLISLKKTINLHNKSINYIAHTRWATHGSINDKNSHPHVSYCNKISLVIMELLKII